MRKVLLASIALGLVLGAWALSSGPVQPPPAADLVVDVQDRNPWTHLRVNADPEQFQFAMISDRTGGHRAQVFSMAVDQINLLQPSFVVSVGDLIEGYTKDKARLAAEWKEFQGYVNKLQMPFFYVPGNHDIANAAMESEWKERFGRPYYHFVYKNVLFLCLNSSDPYEEKGPGQIGKEQQEYFQKVLEDNKTVRWTVVLLHKPLWIAEKLDKTGWLEMEEMLRGRPYTVFAGHVHRYQKFVRHGMNYYMLATTGGISKMRGPRYGEFDHIVWITMKKDGPVLANIMLDGVYPENMKKDFTDEEGWVRHGTKSPQPVRGRVLMDGVPVPNAYVVFHALDPDPKKAPVRTGDAFAEADGSFVLSTYKAWDGVPAGNYVATVVLRDPYYLPSGKVGPNRLPERYEQAKTSDLRATIKSGPNEVTLELNSK